MTTRQIFTFDDDIKIQLTKLEQSTGLKGKELHNLILRAGIHALSANTQKKAFTITPRNMGAMIDIKSYMIFLIIFAPQNSFCYFLRSLCEIA